MVDLYSFLQLADFTGFDNIVGTQLIDWLNSTRDLVINRYTC
jgi:hypothetical protein